MKLSFFDGDDGDRPMSEVFETPDLVHVPYVQGLLVALHNAKDAKGKPALMERTALSSHNLLYQAVLYLLEKHQPGILGFKQDVNGE